MTDIAGHGSVRLLHWRLLTGDFVRDFSVGGGVNWKRIKFIWEFGWLKPVVYFIVLGGLFGGLYVYLAPDKHAHESYQTAKVLSSMAEPSEDSARFRYLVELPNGQLHIVSSKAGGLIGTVSATACVELRRIKSSGEIRVRLAQPANCK